MKIINEEQNQRRVELPQVGVPEFIKPELPGEWVDSGTDGEGIAAGLGLSELNQKIAWMDSSGMPVWAIERALGLGAGSVLNLRSKGEYKTMVARCVRARAAAKVAAAESVEDLLNGEIENNIVALMEVRDNPFEKGANRIKASTELMDRTPKAPKARREIEERRTIISIPVSGLAAMRQALIDEGTKEDKDIIELLEGVDFKGDGDEREDGEKEKESIKAIDLS